MPNLQKAAGILIKDGTLLVCRTRGKDTFFAPGGRLEAGETPEQALIRELREEVGIEVSSIDLQPFGTFMAPASGDESTLLRMDVFRVGAWQGEPHPSCEVEEIAWITSADEVRLGSIFAHEVVPRLRAAGLLRP
jgi:mutator protein MutT